MFQACGSVPGRALSFELRYLNVRDIYHHQTRSHLSLGKDPPEPHALQPPEKGRVIEIADVGVLHHRYERQAAQDRRPFAVV